MTAISFHSMHTLPQCHTSTRRMLRALRPLESLRPNQHETPAYKSRHHQRPVAAPNGPSPSAATAHQELLRKPPSARLALPSLVPVASWLQPFLAAAFLPFWQPALVDQPSWQPSYLAFWALLFLPQPFAAAFFVLAFCCHRYRCFRLGHRSRFGWCHHRRFGNRFRQ